MFIVSEDSEKRQYAGAKDILCCYTQNKKPR
jgi:hypothetical protein